MFAQKQLTKFHWHVDIIVPMNNDKMSNHQFPHAKQIFYEKDCIFRENGIAKQYVYQPKSVYETTGFNPRDYFASGFDDNLLKIVNHLNVVVKHHLGSQCGNSDLEFNFLEIKLYLGNSMYEDKNGKMMVGDDNKVINTG